MIHIGPSSETNFKAKLIHGTVLTGPEQRQSPLGFNREDQSPDDFVEQPPPSVFSSVEGQRITNFKDKIPLEKVSNVVDWLSKRYSLYQV